MIVRIVKMIFQTKKTIDFLDNFYCNKEPIKSFEECLHLDFLQEKDRDNGFFIYSWWKNRQNLENYRHPELFKEI